MTTTLERHDVLRRLSSQVDGLDVVLLDLTESAACLDGVGQRLLIDARRRAASLRETLERTEREEEVEAFSTPVDADFDDVT